MAIKLSSINKTKHATPPRILLHGGEKSGKALAIDTQIPTPTGFKPMGELNVNDEIFAGDGSICRVLGATEIMYDRPCYKVTMHNGQEIVADESHLWKTRIIHNTTGKPSYKTTLEIGNTLTSPRNKTTKNHLIQWHHGTKTPDVDLPLDPYTLGFWLGNGQKDAARVSVAARDVDVTNHFTSAGIEWKFNRFDSDASCHTVTFTGKTSYGKIKTILRNLNMLGNKHIPELYLNSGYEQRLELLRGLMDSDGWVDKPPRSAHNFCVTDRALALGFYQLIQSLGIVSTMRTGRAKLYGKDCGEQFDFTFSPKNVSVVTTAFKVKRALLKNTRIRPHQQNIDNVEKVDSVPVRCIQVSSNDGMFLASEGYVPTHNSSFMAGAPNPIFIQTEDGLKGIDTNSFPLAKTYDDVLEALTALHVEDHDFKMVVIDSADWLERLIHDKVCQDSGVESIEMAGGGYGKGYGLALTLWREVLTALDSLNEKKHMLIGVVCHSTVVSFNDPEHEPYDRYEMKLHQPKRGTGARDLLSEWADIIGFASPQIFVTKKGDKGKEVKRGMASGGTNRLNLVGAPAFIAGNRYSLPAQVDLNWQAFYEVLLSATKPPAKTTPATEKKA